MQDHYSADVGDYVTFSLMWDITRPATQGGGGLSLGLNWYLGSEQPTNGDGRFVSYLEAAHPRYRRLAQCDPEVFLVMGEVHRTQRTVANLERRGAVPAGSPTHALRLVETSLASRERWHRRALHHLDGPEVVFVDPDNGFRQRFRGPTMNKFAFEDELHEYARRGQAVVAYCHSNRTAPVTVQARSALDRLSHSTGLRPVASLVARVGSCRYFVMVAPPRLVAPMRRAARTYADRFEGFVSLA
jgi:hypothetical protein